MGNLRAFIPILLSILIALGGSYFLYQWIKDKTAPSQVVTVKESKVFPAIVAKVYLPWGSRITPEMLTTKSYLEESLPIGHFVNPVDLANRIVVSPIREGEPVVEHRLAPTTLETGGISAILKDGTRAISVKGNNVLGIAGFINPGNRVDVLVTIQDPTKEEPVTKIVLGNLLVLASGRQIVENSKGEAAPVDVYTLEVTPEEGERITLAANKGQLQFALRGAVDSEIVLTKGITVPELLKSMMVKVEEKETIPATSVAGKSSPVKKTSRYTRPGKKSNKASVEIIKGLTLTKKEITI